MAKNIQLSDAIVNAQATVIATALNGGFMDIYDGTQPATSDTAITTQVKGVRLTFGSPAFGSPNSGVITANPMTAGIATTGITPTWVRLLKSDGTVVMDASVGTDSATNNVVLGAFQLGANVSCAGFTFDVRNSTAGF